MKKVFEPVFLWTFAGIKHIFLISLAILFYNQAVSQKRIPKFFTELSMGPSIPVGKFGEKKYNTDYTPESADQPGIAKTGIAVSATIGRYLNEHLGVIVIINVTRNMQDDEVIRQTLAQKYPGFIVTAHTNSWNMFNTLAGMFLHDKIARAKKLSWQIRVLGGVTNTHKPAFSYIIFNQTQGGVQSINDKRKLTTAFAIYAGAGIEYALNERWYIPLHVNYLHAKPALKYNYNPNFPASGSQDIKETYPVHSISITTGIGIRW